MGFPLTIRTPAGLAYEGEVEALRAEDTSGWFGVRAGREDLVAVLPPGLLLLRDAAGEAFVALSGGLLSVERGACQVTAREAVLSRDLAQVAGRIDALQRRRGVQAAVQRDVLDRLAREALRNLVREGRR